VVVAWLLSTSVHPPGAEPAGTAHAQQSPQLMLPEAGDLTVLQLRPNFYVIAGAGGNVGVQVGEDGVVVVDTGTANRSAAIIAIIKKLSLRPIRYIIDTNADPDHVGGNEALSKAGDTLFTNPGSIALGGNFIGGAASILSAEGVLRRMSAPTGQVSPYPGAALPTETFDHARKYMYLNGEGIEIFNQPAAHTDGDVLVFFRRSDVVMAGDVFDTTRFPVIDVARGGSVQGTIAALDKLAELAIPSVPIVSRDAGTIVVPGHGHLSDQLEVVEYRDMLSIIRDRVQELVSAGRTLEQVKATAPARGYTRRFGADSGPWTTNQFIEAVYQSLAKGKR
jgi:glyoxylase-like metal-dependent hydrolase (beta-lactamase superfamily II)